MKLAGLLSVFYGYFPRMRTEYKLLSGFTLLLSICLFAVYGYGQQIAHGDFFVFYTSGINFSDGLSLYKNKASGLTFMYPPFAASFHQVFSVFDLKSAAAVFYGLNLLTLYLLLAFTFYWFQFRWGLSVRVWFFTCVITAYYFYLNLLLGQNNIFLFLLTICALELWLRDKWMSAGLVLSMVIFFKLTALFIAAWMIIRGKPKFILGLSLGFVFCLLFPVVFRGWEQSIRDWQEFYKYFFRFMLQGHVYTDYRNQNLAATLLRLFTLPETSHAPVNIFSRADASLKYVFKWLLPAIALLPLVLVAYRRFQKAPLILAEPALVLIASHLCSGLTWNQHLISLMLFTPILLHNLNQSRYANIFMILLLCLAPLSASLFIGNPLQYFTYSLGLFTWILLGSYLYLMIYLISMKGDNPGIPGR